MIEISAFSSGSKGNCYMVTDGVTPILLECGISYKEIQKCLNFQTSRIAGCLVSHEHKDHCKAASEVAKAGVDIYLSQGTAGALGLTGHRVRVVKVREQFQIGTWAILPFEVEHDVLEPLGFLLANQAGDKLLYATDTYYVRYKFTGLTHIMIEANYSLDILQENVDRGSVPAVLKDRLVKSHFSLANVKDFLRANDLSKVQEIWLIHLSDGNSDAARFRREVQELTGKVVYTA